MLERRTHHASGYIVNRLKAEGIPSWEDRGVFKSDITSILKLWMIEVIVLKYEIMLEEVQ